MQFLNLTSFYIKLIFYDPKDIANCKGCSNFNPGCEITSSYLQNLGYYLGYRILDDNKYTLDFVFPPLTADTISDWDMSGILLSKKEKIFEYLANGNDISVNEIGSSIIQILESAGNPPMQNSAWPYGYYRPTSDGNVLMGQAKATVNLIGSEYLLFVINDYTQSFPNNGLVSISKISTKLDLPAYAYELEQDYSANICDYSANSMNS